ncbi:hypothetical protein RHS04_08599 [Rhizoctonia solani]|uniref:Uncharacterized protein n=1 Tax=Rhizoctonia solani TaxID=456999 RepID=A0A8H7H1T5_9AGAM|nr:hypothetical protein RHS04_08599 [Rhizoctonia solani]
MPKATKSKPTTQPSKPVLSSAEKAARRAHATEYKNAKASTVESTLKGPRYHDEDNEDGGDDKGDCAGEGKGEGGGEEDGNGEEEENENANAFVEFEAPKQPPYKSKCGQFIYIPNETGEYTKFSILKRPQGKLKGLTTHMELDGRENKDLVKGIQDCTYPKLAEEQRSFIMIQARNKYPYLARFRNNWVTKELIIRSLTNKRDHQARIKKAGGQAAWCDKLKAQREEKKLGKTNKSTGGSDRSPIHPSTPTKLKDHQKSRTRHGKQPDEEGGDKSDSEEEVISVPKPSSSKHKITRRIEDSEDEAGCDNEPTLASKPSSSKPGSNEVEAPKPATRPTTPAAAENGVNSTPILTSATSKRAAEDNGHHAQKKVRVRPVAESEEEAAVSEEPTPAPQPSILARAKAKAKAKAQAKAKAMAAAAAAAAAAAEAAAAEAAAAAAAAEVAAVDSDSELELELEPELEATTKAVETQLDCPTVSSTATFGTPTHITEHDTAPTQNPVIRIPTPCATSPHPPALPSDQVRNAILDSSVTQEPQPSTKKNTRAGRRAKQELIDNADSLLGTPVPAPPKRLTRGSAKGIRA